jgi:hypothetical protein
MRSRQDGADGWMGQSRRAAGALQLSAVVDGEQGMPDPGIRLLGLTVQ